LAVDFGPPSDELSQGDLFSEVPSVYVDGPGYMVKVNGTYQLRDERPASHRLDRPQAANAKEVRELGVVLTHDCEIDKTPTRASVILGLVRPLQNMRDSDADGFRSNTRHRALYLPPSGFVEGESYIDLRRVSVLRRDVLEGLPRLASMNDDGRRMLREQLFRFYSRRYLPADWVLWTEDQE
jgi:hypothetical protein